MTAEYLYELYTAANEEGDCSVDSWEELDEADRAMWQRLADKIARAFC